MPDPADLIETLSLRHDLLRALLEEPMARHVLVDHVGDSKSTVYRGVSQLQEAGLVWSGPDGLEPTAFGLVALARYDELARTAAMEPLLADLPDAAVDQAALRGAEPVVPDNLDVDRHHDRVESLLERATAVRGFSPAISPAYLTTIPRRVREDVIRLEFVLTDDIVGFMAAEYPDALSAAETLDSVSLYRTDEALPVTLLLIETPAGTTVCLELGEAGQVDGLLVNDTPAARRWAESAFDRRRRAAEPISADSSGP